KKVDAYPAPCLPFGARRRYAPRRRPPDTEITRRLTPKQGAGSAEIRNCLHDSITTCTVSALIDPGYDQGKILISSRQSIDTTIDLSILDRSGGIVTFTACDGFMTCVSESRDYTVENSAHLVLWQAFDKGVVDFRYGQVLLADVKRQSGPSFSLTTFTDASIYDSRDSGIRRIDTSIRERIYDVAMTPDRGFFTLTDSYDDFRLTKPLIYQTRAGITGAVLQYPVTEGFEIKSAGNFIALKTPQWIQHKSVDADRIDSIKAENILASYQAGYKKVAWTLSENGTVYLTRNDSLIRWRAGTEELLESTANTGEILEMTAEGDLLAFRRNDGLYLYDGTGTKRLCDGDRLSTTTPLRLAGGWLAFARKGKLNQEHIWVISPQGNERQITFFGTSSALESLAPDGDVIFSNGDTRYWAHPDGTQVLISKARGNVFRHEGGFYSSLGNSLFQLRSEPQTSLGRAPGTPSRPAAAALMLTGADSRSRVRLSAPAAGNYAVFLTDLQGKTRKRLYSGHLEAGSNTVEADLTGVENGFYPVRLRLIGP
ncbi:MAG TPA: hypothetical protein VJ385_11785, partial [Fibrobacteria bacterium]|nr:hypothetical protein [Fibrobacteria bacterium]